MAFILFVLHFSLYGDRPWFGMILIIEGCSCEVDCLPCGNGDDQIRGKLWKKIYCWRQTCAFGHNESFLNEDKFVELVPSGCTTSAYETDRHGYIHQWEANLTILGSTLRYDWTTSSFEGQVEVDQNCFCRSLLSTCSGSSQDPYHIKTLVEICIISYSDIFPY